MPVSLRLPENGPASLPVAPPAATEVVEHPVKFAVKVSVTATPVAVLGPMLEATIVYVTGVPGISVALPLFLVMATSALAFTVPPRLRVKVALFVSLVVKVNAPLGVLAAAANIVTVKVVEVFGATVGLAKFVKVKPDGTDKFESVRLAVPLLVTVKVLVTGVPTVVVPKLKLPPFAILPTPVSETTNSGAAATAA